MAKSETCSRCGEEVRRGTRAGKTGHLHRLPVDHEPIFGAILTDEEKAEVERQRHVVRTMEDGTPYTVAEYERKKMSKKKRDALDHEEADEEEGHDEIEPVEIHSIPLPEKGRVFVGCPDGSVALAATPGGVRTVLNLAARLGWEVVRLTYSRGPYLGSAGKSLGISDSVVLHVRHVRVDGVVLRGVASWRDGKSDWAWQVEGKQTTRVGAKALIAWMKENPSGPITWT